MGLPTISSVFPNVGSFYGGNTVTLHGSGFSVSTPTVYFGQSAGSSVSVVSDSSLTVVAPATLAVENVYVSAVTTSGSSAQIPASSYIYVDPIDSPNYSVNNVFFNPLAAYQVYGEWSFAKSPVFPRPQIGLQYPVEVRVSPITGQGGATVALFLAPWAGSFDFIGAAIDGAITSSNVTISPAIYTGGAGVGVPSGLITILEASSSAGVYASAVPSSLNTFSSGSMISAVISGGSGATIGAVITLLVTRTA
jgi:hypothetical protein